MTNDTGLYTIAGWTLRVVDARHNELVTTLCELCPSGLYIATDSADHGLAVDGRVLILFCSGELQFELGATVSRIGWCTELGAEGIGLKLDTLAPEVISAFAATPYVAA
ncbi:MAG: hypothetical protein GY811_01150 [Myxococcales bacterium]|nr:hypothetical protein [Myxococcales bacterium]